MEQARTKSTLMTEEFMNDPIKNAINFLQDYHDLLKEEERDGTADDVWSAIEDLKELKETE